MQDILLLQFRDDAMREHEYRCILAGTGLAPERVRCVDALAAAPAPETLRDVGALFLGGSGRYCVSQREPETLPALFALVREARRAGLPTLGICFGAHLLTAAFGGEVRHEPALAETGSFLVRRLSAAADDPLFSPLPSAFWAQMGHKDFIGAVPAGAADLAASDRASCQAWTFPGERIYALQFHPELTRQGLTERALFYLDEYLGDDRAAIRRVIDEAQTSPEAASLLPGFLRLAGIAT